MRLRSHSPVARLVARADDVKSLSYPEGGGKPGWTTSPQCSANANVHR